MRSKRSPLLVGLLLGVTLGVGAILSINDVHGAKPRATPQIDAPPPASSPPPNPVQFRVLRTVPVSEAVPLVKLLQQEDPAAEIRKDLAGIYRSAGYYGAARFFENTARLAGGEALDVSPVVSPIAWAANADVLSDRPQRVAKEISDLSAAGQYGAAIEKANAEIQGHGLSLQVVAEWSDAVLWKVIEDRKTVSDEAVEVALRILLTSVEEQTHRPRGIWTRASGYQRISDVFLALDDPVSALTAATLALATAEPGSPPEGLGDFTRHQLCDRVAKLEGETGLAGAPSHDDLCGH